MSFGFDIKPLLNSIKRIGLINSPILIKKEKGEGALQYEVIAGFRRISALRALSLNPIPCRILPSETPSLDCLLINLHENLASRDFNPVEKGMVLTRLLDLIPERDVLGTYMPLFDLPSHKETLHLFERVDKVFEHQAKTLLASEYLSMKAAKLLIEMGGAERNMFCGYFSIVRFSKNQQTQFIDLVSDLSHIENNPITYLLMNPQLKDIRDNPQMNNPQKARALITFLRKKRLPRLVKTENGFKQMIENLALPSGFQIIPPPFFEGAYYRLEISFEDGKELKEKLQFVAKNERLAAFENPWKMTV
ncbi:MAG: ParB/RepB/Spo0J family partition protein [Deltaproteobacteria bacterium]|nr:ParB/RepB/Spo0J family partition protein [Deltaproteobacteria bacterium]